MFKTIYYCLCECEHMCVMVHMWRSEDHTHEWILFHWSFQRLNLGNQVCLASTFTG